MVASLVRGVALFLELLLVADCADCVAQLSPGTNTFGQGSPRPHDSRPATNSQPRESALSAGKRPFLRLLLLIDGP
jgi:hypothetical protein